MRLLFSFSILILTDFLLFFAFALQGNNFPESWSVDGEDDGPVEESPEGPIPMLTLDHLYDASDPDENINLEDLEEADHLEQIQSEWNRHESERAARPNPPELPEGIITGELKDGITHFADKTLQLTHLTTSGEFRDGFTGELGFLKQPDRHEWVHVWAFRTVEYLRGFLHTQKMTGASGRCILKPLALVYLPDTGDSLAIIRYTPTLEFALRNFEKSNPDQYLYKVTLVMADILDIIKQMHEKGIYRPSLIFSDMGMENNKPKLRNFEKTTDENTVQDVGYLAYGSHGKLLLLLLLSFISFFFHI